jgi:hypothetical protein
VFYVFKDEAAGQAFLASRQRRKTAAPRKRISEVRFEQNRELLEPFLATIAALGRLPEDDEFVRAAEVVARFGSLKRAFALLKRVTGADEWDAITRRNTEDLLVYLALGRFRRRPPISALPIGLQRDIRAFFGSGIPGDLRSGPRRGRETRAEPGPAAWPTSGCSRPATLRPSMMPADARPSASCCPTPCISTAVPWNRLTYCSASMRAAPGLTSARSKERT